MSPYTAEKLVRSSEHARAPIARVEARFKPGVAPADVDTIVAEALFAARLEPGQRMGLILNFEKSSFVQLAVLQMVIALAKQLLQKGHKVGIRLPHSKHVRDIWSRWGFADGLRAATGFSLWDLVPESERQLRLEPITYYPAREIPSGPGFSQATIRSSNFFGFHTEALRKSSIAVRRAIDEASTWRTQYIQDFLVKNVGLALRAAEYLPSRVVFEAFMNSMRHPDASCLQISAFFNRNTKKKPIDAAKASVTHNDKSAFTVHFWDDGSSMLDTITAALNANVKVRSDYPSDFDRVYFLRYSDDDDPNSYYEKEVRSESFDPDTSTSPHQVLMSAVFPGITSDPAGRDHHVDEEVSASDPRLGRPGMGLYVLVNAAVEVLGGEVSFRTANYFMNIRRLKQTESKRFPSSQIQVRIKRRPNCLPRFLGNLVVIRLKPSR